jgi:excisionase family DNA binding protein
VRRFLDLSEVADVLAVSRSQVYALVRTGALRAVKIGGRGMWRVEGCALEDYISSAYAATTDLIATDTVRRRPTIPRTRTRTTDVRSSHRQRRYEAEGAEGMRPRDCGIRRELEEGRSGA